MAGAREEEERAVVGSRLKITDYELRITNGIWPLRFRYEDC